ncbi:MAG: geranylgeranylglycerol-phosphate geranylgeranyltransferase [Bacteroidales bacterium]|nr:geranylgeranylglycerol-phosphate geranylgeranyltransferase [Bacteroidales bacterium]
MKLIRWPNLIIVVLTQYLMRWGILEPILEVNRLDLQLDSFHFFLLVLSTVCITAGGYVINDYFDTHTDLLNKPREVLVGTKVHRRFAIIFHVVLNIIGVGLGFYLSWHVGIPYLGLIFPLVSGVLWFYSTTYKRQFLVGNLVVAVLTALVPLMVVVFEIPMLNEEYKDLLLQHNTNFMYLFHWVMGFAFFAFIMNLMLELIKDIEDYEGDRMYGRKSLPVVLGVKTSKNIVNLLVLITLAGLNYVYFRYLEDIVTLIYFSLFLYLPFIFLIVKNIKATDRLYFAFIGNVLKVIMLFGVLYALMARYIIQTQVI